VRRSIPFEGIETPTSYPSLGNTGTSHVWTSFCHQIFIHKARWFPLCIRSSILPQSQALPIINLATIQVLDQPPIPLFNQPNTSSIAIMSLHCTYHYPISSHLSVRCKAVTTYQVTPRSHMASQLQPYLIPLSC
jgi:hypothetical protein